MLLLKSFPLQGRQHPLEELLFENRAGLYFTDQGTLVVIQNASTYKASVIDPETYKIRNDLLFIITNYHFFASQIYQIDE